VRGKRCPGRRKGEEELEARELLFLMFYLDEGAASFLGGGGGGGGGACVLRIRVSQTYRGPSAQQSSAGGRRWSGDNEGPISHYAL